MISIKVSSIANIYDQTSSLMSAYLFSLNYIVYTITTVGFGGKPAEHPTVYLFSMLLKFVGVLLFGFLFSRVVTLFDMFRSYDDMVEKRDFDFQGWLKRREQMSHNTMGGLILFRLGKAQRFFWDWDADSRFHRNRFYQKLTKEQQELVSKNSSIYMKTNFSALFGGLENEVHEPDLTNLMMHLRPIT